MPDSRSDTLHHSYHKATEQFDYFILAGIGATVAYAVQHIEPAKLDSVSYDISLAAIILLFIAALFGFLRVSTTLQLLKINANQLHSLETRGKMVAAIPKLQQGEDMFNSETGAPVTLESAIKQIQAFNDAIPKMQDQFKKMAKRAIMYWNFRNWLFLLGFLGLFISKVVSPYLK